VPAQAAVPSHTERWKELGERRGAARRWLGPLTGDFCAAEGAASGAERAQRASTSGWAALFERRERSEHSEFDAPAHDASTEGSRPTGPTRAA